MLKTARFAKLPAYIDGSVPGETSAATLSHSSVYPIYSAAARIVMGYKVEWKGLVRGGVPRVTRPRERGRERESERKSSPHSRHFNFNFYKVFNALAAQRRGRFRPACAV